MNTRVDMGIETVKSLLCILLLVASMIRTVGMDDH